MTNEFDFSEVVYDIEAHSERLGELKQKKENIDSIKDIICGIESGEVHPLDCELDLKVRAPAIHSFGEVAPYSFKDMVDKIGVNWLKDFIDFLGKEVDDRISQVSQDLEELNKNLIERND